MLADRLDRVGVEASSLGIWLYRELQPAGVPIIVVEARHMRVSLSRMRNKTDRNDARGIAQMMRLGWYRAVHVKNIDMQMMRSLLAQQEAPQAQADRHRKSHSWHAASVWLADGSRWSRRLLRVRKWSALRAWGLRIAKRSSMLCAIVPVARKLAGILHRMWVSKTDFHVGFGAKVTQRLRLKPAQ